MAPAIRRVIPFGVLTAAILFAIAANTQQQKTGAYTSPLPTGVRLDSVGDFVDLGSMPLGMAVAPGGKELVVVLSGWREQGFQVIDLVSRTVTQTVTQNAAFYGAAFSRDGTMLYISGGNEDSIFAYRWHNGAATFDKQIVLGQKKEDKTGSRYPAGIAVSRNGNFVYLAENVADDLAVIDPASSQVLQRFATDHYPYAVESCSDGYVYVSAWGGQTVSIFRSREEGTLSPSGRLQVGSRPSALTCSADGSRLFVALAGTDQIAEVDTHLRRITRLLHDSAPGAPSEGSTPNALALSSDGSRLYAAEADNNAVAVFDVARRSSASQRPEAGPVGRIPSDWYPTAIVELNGQILIANGKGHGSHANPDGPIPGEGVKRRLGYDLGQLNGTLRIVAAELNSTTLAEYSRRVSAANGWSTRRVEKKYPPFKHVVYIIKENRTYDQVLGDLKQGDGDPNLVFFGQEVSPNHHALALRFGLFDRFFTNAEVSSQGHIWSTAAYVTDYGEKTIPSLYSDRRGNVDGEDVDEPIGGFLWNLAAKKGIWFRDYGEMVKGPEGWPVTQRDLRADVSPVYPEFNLKIPDQKRADAWIQELNGFVQQGQMPALEVLHLPSDHTAGGRAGFPTPRAYMADNDLALGRIVEALSHSPFWQDTVVFVLEDDSQAGPDHIDSHRSPFFAISAYSRAGTVHRFANTTDVIAAIEDILGLARMSKYDYFSRSLADIFSRTPDLTPYQAVFPKTDLRELNPGGTPAARLSQDLDWSAPDKVNDALFNRILWTMMKGSRIAPSPKVRAPMQLLQSSE